MADTVSCTNLERYQVHVRTPAHALTADFSKTDGGDGLGPSPFELLLGSLGACTVATVVHFAGTSGIALHRVWADLAGERGDDKTYRIRVALRVRGDLSETDVKRLLGYARQCHVHKELSRGIEIAIAIERV